MTNPAAQTAMTVAHTHIFHALAFMHTVAKTIFKTHLHTIAETVMLTAMNSFKTNKASASINSHYRTEHKCSLSHCTSIQ
jgi:hypothetical protein